MLRFVCACGVLCFLGSGGIALAAPSAQIDRVQLAPRADLYKKAWSTSVNTYADAYVNPKTRVVRLDGCGSRSDGAVPASSKPAFLWLLEPRERQPGAVPIRIESEAAACAVEARLPAMGRWRITLTTSDAAGLTATTVLDVVFRDLLVAAVGDSFASGEGNKPWADGQCHRSRDSPGRSCLLAPWRTTRPRSRSSASPARARGSSTSWTRVIPDSVSPRTHHAYGRSSSSLVR